MQHTVKELLEKIESMKDRALVLNSLVDQKQNKEDWQHHLDQIQAMAGDIANDRNGNKFQLTFPSIGGKMVFVMMHKVINV